MKFNQDGQKILMTLGKPASPAPDPTYLSRTVRFYVAPNGDIFVADGTGGPAKQPPNDQVRPRRESSFKEGQEGLGPGGSTCRQSCDGFHFGRCSSAIAGNNRIQVFDKGRQVSFGVAGSSAGRALVIDKNDMLYVAEMLR